VAVTRALAERGQRDVEQTICVLRVVAESAFARAGKPRQQA